MPDFNSALISTTNLGSWDYYIFSDNVGIWRAMNGLAAWFGASGGMIQGAAWLGALLLLAITLFAAATHKPGLGAGPLGIWFFFMTLMGTTGTANVFNIYTGQVTVIANVPALALIPASVFSKGAYKVFTSMDTAFQGVNGSYMSISQNGFMGPLEILLSLRSPALSNATPALNLTLTQVVHDCAIDPNGTPPPVAMSASHDMLNWLVTYGRQSGLTTIYNDANPEGLAMGCGAALAYVDNQYEIMASGSTPLLNFVNSSTTAKNPQDSRGLWRANNIVNSYDMLIGQASNVQQTATQFTKNALVASTVTYTMDCLSQSGSITSPETCAVAAIPNADTMSRFQTESTMNASGFLKTMFTSMALLQALFFALFPIIALYGLIVVQSTAKIFGGYIFFGIWCQSWLLVVAPIQSYIQTSIVDEMSKITAGDGGMTLANSMQLYTKLATKLAIASDIMASSQMLSLALLSGSMVALSSLAGRWSGEKHVDTSKVQLDPAKTAPMVQNVSGVSQQGIVDKSGNSIILGTGAGAGKASVTSSVSTTQGSTKGSEVSSGSSKDKSSEWTLGLAKSSGFAISRDQATQVAKSLSAVDTWKGTVSGIPAALGAFGKHLLADHNKGAPATPEQQAKMDKLQQDSIASATATLAAKDSGFLTNIMGKNGREAQADAAGTLLDVAGGVMLAGSVVLTGGAALAAAPGAMAARQLAKEAIKTGIKEVGKAEAKVLAAGGVGAAVVAKNASTMGAIALGGAALVSSALNGNFAAMYSTAVTEDLKQTTTGSTGKKLTRGSNATAAQADKIGQSYSVAQRESESNSKSSGETQIASLVLDQGTLFRAATAGVDGQSPETTRENASLRIAQLRATQTNEQQRLATSFANNAMAGWKVSDFGDGTKAQEITDFMKNVFYEHASVQNVTGTMTAQQPLGNLIGGPSVPTAPPAPVNQALPKTPQGASINPNYGSGYINRADNDNFNTYNKTPDTAKDNAVNNPGLTKELSTEVKKNEQAIRVIGATGAAGSAAGAVTNLVAAEAKAVAGLATKAPRGPPVGGWRD